MAILPARAFSRRSEVHCRHRAQVDALVDEARVHLDRRLIDEPVATEEVEDGTSFGGGELVLRVRAAVVTAGPAAAGRALDRAAMERTTPVSVVAPGRIPTR